MDDFFPVRDRAVPPISGFRAIVYTLFVVWYMAIALVLYLTAEKTMNVLNGFYYAIQGLSTVGYGDKVPPIFGGRIAQNWVMLHAFMSVPAMFELTDYILYWILRVFPLLSSKMVRVISLLAGIPVLVLIGSLAIFFLEKGETVEDGQVKIFSDSVCLSIATLTTIGFGDLSFHTSRGKLFSLFWMPFSSILASKILLGLYSFYKKFLPPDESHPRPPPHPQPVHSPRLRPDPGPSPSPDHGPDQGPRTDPIKENVITNRETPSTEGESVLDDKGMQSFSPNSLKAEIHEIEEESGSFSKLLHGNKNEEVRDPEDNRAILVTTGDRSASSSEDLNLSPEAIMLQMILMPTYRVLIAQVHNGSGKTTFCVVGMPSRGPQALCVCPTRELPVLNMEVLQNMGRYMGIIAECVVPTERTTGSITCLTRPITWVYGGSSEDGEMVPVFDEADHMLDLDGFEDDSLRIKEIEKYSPQCQERLKVCNWELEKAEKKVKWDRAKVRAEASPKDDKGEDDNKDAKSPHEIRVYKKYRITEICGDGRCLFRALSYGDSLKAGGGDRVQMTLADSLRRDVVNQLIRRRPEIEHFIEGDFDEYASRMRNPLAWGGEPELLMASEVLQTPITVYEYNDEAGGLIIRAEYGADYDNKPITVVFSNNNHYDLVTIGGEGA